MNKEKEIHASFAVRAQTAELRPLCLSSACCCVLSGVCLSATSWTITLQASLSLEFSSKHTGVGGQFLLQGILPTQGSNPCLLCLLHRQVGSLPLPYLGSPESLQKVLKGNKESTLYMTRALMPLVTVLIRLPKW